MTAEILRNNTVKLYSAMLKYLKPNEPIKNLFPPEQQKEKYTKDEIIERLLELEKNGNK